MTVPAGEGISQKPESAVHFPVFTLALFREGKGEGRHNTANLFQHVVQLRHHLIIPKAQHAIPTRFQETCSGLISRVLFRVLSTIEFDN